MRNVVRRGVVTLALSGLLALPSTALAAGHAAPPAGGPARGRHDQMRGNGAGPCRCAVRRCIVRDRPRHAATGQCYNAGMADAATNGRSS